MRAILLAAGRGQRLGWSSPKCLLRFDGTTLLERHVRLLDATGVDELVVAVGHERAQVEAELARLGVDARIVVNERFDEGSLLTVHTVADALTAGDDVLLMDADVLYDARVLAPLVDGEHANRLLIDRGFEPGDEPVKVCVRDGAVVGFGKRVPAGLAYDTIGESVGFFRFTEATARRLVGIVAAHVDAGRTTLPHEDAVRELLLDGARVDVTDVTGAPWLEIDFPVDVERATRDVLPRLEPLAQAVR